MSYSLFEWCRDNEKSELLSEWNYDRNEVKPSEVMPSSHKKVWWICDKGHQYEQIIKEKVLANHKCPYCRTSLHMTDEKIRELNNCSIKVDRIEIEKQMLEDNLILTKKRIYFLK